MATEKVHLAGKYENGKQFCQLCGAVILDRTNTQSLTSDEADHAGFTEGVYVIVGRGFKCATPLDDDARRLLCTMNGKFLN